FSVLRCSLFELFQLQIAVFRLLLSPVPADPGLYARSTPRRVDQPDRYVQLFLKFLAEVICDCRETANVLGVAFQPLALLGIIFKDEAHVAAHGKKAKARKIG